MPVVQWGDLRRAPKPGPGQQPDVLLTLRASNAAMRSSQYQEEIINQVGAGCGTRGAAAAAWRSSCCTLLPCLMLRRLLHYKCKLSSQQPLALWYSVFHPRPLTFACPLCPSVRRPAQVMELLAEHLGCWGCHIAFPELAFLTTSQLRKFMKTSPVDRFK